MITDNTFEIAKTFYEISNAQKRLDMLCLDNISHDARKRLQGYSKRLAWIITDMLTSLPRNSADTFRSQVCTFETLSFDEIFREMILMSEEQRSKFEELTKAYRRNEVIFVDETTNNEHTENQRGTCSL